MFSGYIGSEAASEVGNFAGALYAGDPSEACLRDALSTNGWDSCGQATLGGSE